MNNIEKIRKDALKFFIFWKWAIPISIFGEIKLLELLGFQKPPLGFVVILTGFLLYIVIRETANAVKESIK